MTFHPCRFGFRWFQQWIYSFCGLLWGVVDTNFGAKGTQGFRYLQSLSAVNTLGARLETNFEILLTFPQENHFARGLSSWALQSSKCLIACMPILDPCPGLWMTCLEQSSPVNPNPIELCYHHHGSIYCKSTWILLIISYNLHWTKWTKLSFVWSTTS